MSRLLARTPTTPPCRNTRAISWSAAGSFEPVQRRADDDGVHIRVGQPGSLGGAVASVHSGQSRVRCSRIGADGSTATTSRPRVTSVGGELSGAGAEVEYAVRRRRQQPRDRLVRVARDAPVRRGRRLSRTTSRAGDGLGSLIAEYVCRHGLTLLTTRCATDPILRHGARSQAFRSCAVWSPPWTCASSPSRSKARPTTTCSASRRRARTSGSTRSSAPTICSASAKAIRVRARPTRGSPSPGSRARPVASGSARWSPRRRSGCPGRSRSAVAQVDEMSGGRVELGIGAGWYETEHRSYGVPFPPVRERFDRFAEQLAIIDGLWRTPVGQTFSFDGRFYPLVDSPALPKPVQSPRPPIIIGGRGKRRTPELAARYADEFNVPFAVARRDRVGLRPRPRRGRGHRRAGAPLVYSAAQTVCVGRDDAEFARRADAIGENIAAVRRGRPRRLARPGRRPARPLRRGRRAPGLPAGARPWRSRPPGAHRLVGRAAGRRRSELRRVLAGRR